METLRETEIDLQTLPLGQRLLRMGYRRVTEDDVRKLLGCDEIARLEDDARLATLLDLAKAAHPGRQIRTHRNEWSLGVDYRNCLGLWQRAATRNSVLCRVRTTPLETYVGDTIPDRVVREIQRAREAGVQRFVVAWPEVGLTQAWGHDPAVLAELGEAPRLERLLVASWGLEDGEG